MRRMTVLLVGVLVGCSGGAGDYCAVHEDTADAMVGVMARAELAETSEDMFAAVAELDSLLEARRDAAPSHIGEEYEVLLDGGASATRTDLAVQRVNEWVEQECGLPGDM